jgi:integrase
MAHGSIPEFPLLSLPVLPRPRETGPATTRKDHCHDQETQASPASGCSRHTITLATVLAALEQPNGLAASRHRDLRSAVRRVAVLLGNEPAAIPLDMGVIGARLAAVNPVAVGLTAKRLANIRSDFLAAVRASGVMPVKGKGRSRLSPAWVDLFERLSGRRAHIGLSRLARYASRQGITPEDMDDDVIPGFITAVREGSLHRDPNALHRQVALIWNEAARDPALGLRLVTVPSFRGPPKRIDWALLPDAFKQDVDNYLSWCGTSDPFVADARSRALAPRTLELRRDQIRTAVSALVESGIDPSAILSLADLVSPNSVKSILRRRLESISGEENTFFNHNLGKALVQIAREWVKVDAQVSAELKRLVGKMPPPVQGLTDKNKRFLRQFDDPAVLRRLYSLPEKLWAEVRRDGKPNFRTLAKAQAALAVAILCYMPLRLQNLTTLAFDTHLFMRDGARAISTLELPAGEVKNGTELAFDIPPVVAKTLIEYRDRFAPKIVGHRPTRLFVNVDGTPKTRWAVASLLTTCLRRRAGIVVTPHQFRHLSAKVVLDAEAGGFELVKQILGHRSLKTTVGAYAGIDSRRAARRHQHLVERALAAQMPARRSKRRAS